ncbi:MAG: hypothetical protein ACLFRQ_04700 [Desulfonatronovibrio sp.]
MRVVLVGVWIVCVDVVKELSQGSIALAYVNGSKGYLGVEGGGISRKRNNRLS